MQEIVKNGGGEFMEQTNKDINTKNEPEPETPIEEID